MLVRFCSLMAVALVWSACGSMFAGGFDTSATLRDSWSQQLEARRAEVQAAPGSVQAAASFAVTVEGALAAGVADSRPELGRAALLEEGLGYLDRAIASEPAQAASGWFYVGELRGVKGDAAGAEDAYRQALALSPNLAPLPPLLDLLVAQGRAAEVPATCKAARAGQTTPESLYVLVESCREHGDALAWLTKKDRATYEQEAAEVAAQREADAARRRDEQERLRASFGTSEPTAERPESHDSGAPSGGPVSVTFHSECNQNVRLFFGKTPRYGSGRTSTASPNSTFSQTMNEGDLVWIVDESDNGLSSTSISAAMTRITIGCSGFRGPW